MCSSSKLCTLCGEIKSLESFSIDRAHKTGRNSWCRECSSAKNSASWKNISEEQHEKSKEKQHIHYLRNRDKAMLDSARVRAAKLGIPFDLVRSDINIPAYCPVLGIPLKSVRGLRENRDNSPSLDRIIPEKGYVKGNVIVVSFKANRIKSNATADEILAVGNFYKDLK